MVPVFRVGPSHLWTAEAPETHRRHAAGGDEMFRHLVPPAQLTAAWSGDKISSAYLRTAGMRRWLANVVSWCAERWLAAAV
jgi:hypothetical protein